jgi:DNA-binding transcriptional MerR regulator
MLISEFSRTVGLSRDTVRFYVHLGLLSPLRSSKGGLRPYQHFSAEDVRAAKIIRVAQLLGMSLTEIAAISKERREGRMTRERSAAILRGQLEALEAKAKVLQSLSSYLRAKIDWLASGEDGPPPDFDVSAEMN